MYCDAIRRAVLSVSPPTRAADRSAPTNSRQKIARVSPVSKNRPFVSRAGYRDADARVLGYLFPFASFIPLLLLPQSGGGAGRGGGESGAGSFAPEEFGARDRARSAIWRQRQGAMADCARCVPYSRGSDATVVRR